MVDKVKPRLGSLVPGGGAGGEFGAGAKSDAQVLRPGASRKAKEGEPAVRAYVRPGGAIMDPAKAAAAAAAAPAPPAGRPAPAAPEAEPKVDFKALKEGDLIDVFSRDEHWVVATYQKSADDNNIVVRYVREGQEGGRHDIPKSHLMVKPFGTKTRA